MGNKPERLILKSPAEYEAAAKRVGEMRSHGATAETNPELARLEGAVANYVAEPSHPALRRGRPVDEGSST